MIRYKNNVIIILNNFDKKKNWKFTILCSTHYKIIMHSICAYVNIGWAQIERWYVSTLFCCRHVAYRFCRLRLQTMIITPNGSTCPAFETYAVQIGFFERFDLVESSMVVQSELFLCAYDPGGGDIKMTKLSWNVFNIDKAMKLCYVEKNSLK